MVTKTWWVDEPLVMASNNPGDDDLARLRAQGFRLIVSFLDEKHELANYNRKYAEGAGWSLCPLPIKEGGVLSLREVSTFVEWVRLLPEGTKILFHCQSGLGRSAFMSVFYWIAKGLKPAAAIAKVHSAVQETDWYTAERQEVLREYERRQIGA